MSLETFRCAVDLAQAYDSQIIIGGGEPTLNTNILMMLGYAVLLTCEYSRPFMVTNGTCDEETWNILMKARSSEDLDVRVSKDPWHDEEMIGSWVWSDADRYKLWWGESHTRTIVPRGRAKRNLEQLKRDALDWGYDKVLIEKDDYPYVRVDPNGIVWIDTNKAIKIGTLSEVAIDTAHEIVSNYVGG